MSRDEVKEESKTAVNRTRMHFVEGIPLYGEHFLFCRPANLASAIIFHVWLHFIRATGFAATAPVSLNISRVQQDPRILEKQFFQVH